MISEDKDDFIHNLSKKRISFHEKVDMLTSEDYEKANRRIVVQIFCEDCPSKECLLKEDRTVCFAPTQMSCLSFCRLHSHPEYGNQVEYYYEVSSKLLVYRDLIKQASVAIRECQNELARKDDLTKISSRILADNPPLTLYECAAFNEEIQEFCTDIDQCTNELNRINQVIQGFSKLIHPNTGIVKFKDSLHSLRFHSALNTFGSVKDFLDALANKMEDFGSRFEQEFGKNSLTACESISQNPQNL